ncbi:copper resistance protein CopC/CopD [Saccharopolyspora erythraea]|uniref:copper resistance CopC family protein n=1 Tax=Saccharopolyspora erythraea TaxID=1836 RepID=UPI001BACD18C|nr:copper resistance CopC family protein [Saccharopolyspora erythraea]QUH04079.1 copper resistance protein CopC/CopD [Saccharopolyspora erythraea]
MTIPLTIVDERPQRTGRRDRRIPAQGRKVLGLLLVVLGCWATLLISTPAPTGDPVLRTISPGNSETVKSPDRVELTFDRPVPAGLATVRIINPPGEQVVFERPVNPPGRPDTISVPMPKTRFGGTYTVAWTLPSQHLEPLSGAFTFDVFQPTSSAGVPEIEIRHDPAIAAFHTTARFAAVASMAVLIGAVFFVAAIWPAGALLRIVRRVVTGAWIGVVVSTLAVLLSFGPYAAWVPLGDAFDPQLLWGTLRSETGAGLLSRLLLLVPITLGLVELMAAPPAERQGERALRGGAVVGCGAALAATWSLARPHAELTPLSLAVDVVLLVSAAVPVTGLGMLWLLLRGKDRSARHTYVPRWYRSTGACAGLLALVALYHLWHSTDGSVTSHSWLLVGLLALIGLLAGTTTVLRLRLHRHPADPAESKADRRKIPHLEQYRNLAAGGAGLAALLLIATALLVATRPPHTAHAQRIEPTPSSVRQQLPPFRLPFDTGKPGGNGAVDLVLLPRADGPGRVHLDTRVSVRGGPGDMAVTAELRRPGRAPIPVRLTAAGPGYSRGAATVPGHGDWELALTLRAPDGSRQTVTQPLDVR